MEIELTDYQTPREKKKTLETINKTCRIDAEIISVDDIWSGYGLEGATGIIHLKQGLISFTPYVPIILNVHGSEALVSNISLSKVKFKTSE